MGISKRWAMRYPSAYVYVEHRGKRVRCYLAGMEARRVARKETT